MATSSGERRQVTVLFSDVVGSTELSAQLDPEDWHSILSRYQQAVTKIVKHFEGHVYQYLGDGVLVLFGYPKAHENDADRAIRASLAFLEELNSLNEAFNKEFGKTISVRVGIHTGEVMFRQEGSETGSIFGETPNVASRVQTAAEPNSVCISAATQKLVAGFFIVEDLGQHILKGMADPIQLYKVERVSGVRSRLHAGMASLTPFVGREDERNALMQKWRQAQKGKGQLVMVTGEAGIGKSRLLQQFKEDLGGIPHTWIEGESSPYEQDTPFAPTLDLIENAFHWTSESTTEEKLTGLEDSFSLTNMDVEKSVPLMASLLNISIPPNRYPPLLISPEQQRTLLLQTLVDWVLGTARLQPTVLVVEDLHYADPSTLEEFVLLGKQIENSPILLLFTARPRFIPPWPTKPYHLLLSLNRLESDNIQNLITQMLGNLIPKETLNSLVNRADGVPLFAEELSNAIAESRTTTAIEKQIPSSLSDLLTARLDFLGPTKEIAQIASVLGRSFSFSLLSVIAIKPTEELETSLRLLTESGLVFGEINTADILYTFKHALVQESAYSSLLKSRRKELHRAVAIALNENFPEIAKQRPELVAHHLTEAGEAEPALEAWQKAGDFAYSRSAYKEAQRHYQKALDVLVNIPETPERAFIEFPIQAALGRTLQVSEGFGGKKSYLAFSRARDLTQQMGDSIQVQIILLGIWGALNSTSNIIASQEVSKEIFRMAKQSENDMMLTWSYETQAIEAYGLGKFAEVPAYFAELCHYYRTEEHVWSPSDPKVTTAIHMALAQWQLGKPDQAKQTCYAQAELAKNMAPSNIAMAHLGACSLALLMRDATWLLEQCTALSKVAIENDIPNYISWGNIYHGCANILQGNYQTGIEFLTKGVSEYLLTGTHSSLSQYLGILALGYAGANDMEKAFITIDDAFGAAGEEAMHIHELYRIKGSLYLQNNQLDEAEQSLREAIKISKEFNSLSIELRASIELGQLFLLRGDSDSAQTLIAPLYAKFTEGFDTPDLQKAKQLLDELKK